MGIYLKHHPILSVGPLALSDTFIHDLDQFILFVRSSGGGTAFSKSAWTVKEYVCGGDSPYITLYYHSFDGEQGFPGSLDAYVTYRVTSPYTLGVHMNATARDKATPVNLLLHAYWNLGGEGSGRDVLGHTLRLHASRYAVLDAELLPSSGRVAPVAGTPLDFRAPTPIGARIRQVMGGKVVGYDANYIVDGGGEGTMRPVAEVRDAASGRAVELWANQPTVQVYTGNWLNHTEGKGGGVYNQYAGFTLETMGYVDAVNHPEFPSQTLRPGQEYKHDMVFKFSF
jgi:aldose 1-epimerase